VIPELGLFSLVLAFIFALMQSVLPLMGAIQNNVALQNKNKPLAFAQFTFLSISFILLTVAFLTDDFSIKYVAENSNFLLPTMYKFSAVWGAHEGSLLLWVMLLSLWTCVVAHFSQAPIKTRAQVVSIMGMISAGFLLFLICTSNPFANFLPNSFSNGSDLNPLLQDPGLIFHPPMLYMGYVGFSVAFAFALSALIDGKVDIAWANYSRSWTLLAWSFLTLGIVLGSAWAYRELGWGGWWFWDPVENASFMPWLAGTALIHSMAVASRREVFKAWVILLAICVFSLSLLGTFLVRSGILTSVHAFATDPSRGLFMLIYLSVVVGGSLLLYAWRANEQCKK